jgi:adenylate cyclase
VLAGLLHTAPSVKGILLFGKDGDSASLFRTPDGGFALLPSGISTGPQFANLRDLFDLKKIEAADKPVWGRPVPIGTTLFHNVALPLKRGNQVEGVAVAVVGQDMVSQIMMRLANESDATVFMLSEGNGVISHSRLPELFRSRDIISIDEFPDEVLRELPTATEDRDYGKAAERGIRVFTSRDAKGGHIFLTRRLTDYSAEPFTLGVYFAATDLGAEMLRAVNSLLVGLAGMLAAVVAAILLGRRISRPMSEVAEAAAHFSDFRLDDINPLPRSRIREIDDQAVALNRMRNILLHFTRYVPRELVARLMRSGESASHPVEREVTILFSDIMGFTTISEQLNAAEVAHVLNQHFEMVTRNVEATSGTIDKFMGDGVMAFWGAPETDTDHVMHAVRAAEAITRSLHEENAARRELGEAPLRVRMGLHTGRVVVGNIGGPDRHTYTIVGDTVNVAQRLEQLAKDLMKPGDEAVVLASCDVVDASGGKASFTPAGTRLIRGRENPVAVAVLNTEIEPRNTAACA